MEKISTVNRDLSSRILPMSISRFIWHLRSVGSFLFILFYPVLLYLYFDSFFRANLINVYTFLLLWLCFLSPWILSIGTLITFQTLGWARIFRRVFTMILLVYIN